MKPCKQCGGEFNPTGKFDKLCQKCINKSRKIGKEKREKYIKNGVNVGKPYYLR